jgi:predicted transcriptional regulator
MASEELPEPGDPSAAMPAEREADGEGEGEDGGEDRGEGEGSGPPDDRGKLNLTDPKAMRALAHPLRWALLEALGDAGTLTATQASDMLGESPANCAFHLRTLAKYGFVEEAGGGRGRERPWRLSYHSMRLRTIQDDPESTRAAEAVSQVWLDRVLARARHSLTAKNSWPKALDDALGANASRIYVTPSEAAELYQEVQQAYERVVGTQGRHIERRDPKLRPPDAVIVEFALLAYPVLDHPPLPGEPAGSEP